MKRALTIILSAIMLFVFGVSASAATYAQYGLEVTATPAVSANSISFGVTVENISDEEIGDIKLDAIFPQGLSPASFSEDIGTLDGGEKVSFPVNASVSNNPLTLSIGNNSPTFTLASIIIAVIVQAIAAVLLVITLKNKKAKKLFSIILCLVFALPFVPFVQSSAKISDNSFSFTETATLNGADYSVEFTVSSENTELESTISCDNNVTVEKATEDIKGTVISDEKVISVDYKVYSEIDKGDVSFDGKAQLSGGHYVITDTVLKPDRNKIVLTAKTESGKEFEDYFVIDYDSSDIYEETEADISTDKNSGKKYINSIINVLFKENATDSDKNSVVKELNGKKVGYINGANMWQIKVQKSDLDILNSICDKLSKKDFVASAYVDFLDISPNVIPDDPWESATWNEDSPSGYNWSVEMVKALSAWDYDEFFNDISIGFVDTGCDYDHEDLNGKIYFTSTENQNTCDDQNHGTHVAGIMGAIPNNKKGVTGILWNGKIYAHDAKYQGVNDDKEKMTDTKCYNGVVQNIEAGAKVVNLSVGYSTSEIPPTEENISSFSITASSYTAYLLNQGYDFIICQSSGNGNSSGTAVDTRTNGMFCSINQDETGQSEAMAKQIVDRIMVVGSMNSGGTQATSSNYGANVDVAAPGVSIYSTTIGDYGHLSGTSMSSPLVASMLGVIWSVNPNLTGPEVANILKTTAASYRSAYPSATGQTALPVPNLYTAVKAAIATLPARDFSDLDNAIASVPTDLSYYDTDCVNALNTALTTARTINRETASQNKINQVTQDLLDTIYSLKVSLASPAQLTIPKTLSVNGWTFPEVKFTCPGATDIKITFSNNNVIYTEQSGTTDTATVILAENSLTKEDLGTITCMVTYTYDDVTQTLTRYIEVVDEIYSSQPLVDTNIKRSGGGYFSGYNPSLYNIATITGTQRAENPYTNASNGYFDYDANSFICNSDTAVGTQWGGYQLSGDSETNLMDETLAPKGYLYVDATAYSQLSEIPNLAIYIYQYKKCTRASGGTEVLSITTDNENYTVNVANTSLGTSANSVGGSQTYKINGPVPAKTTAVKFYIQTQATSNGALGDNVTTRSAVFLELVIVPQNKTKLSTLLDKLYSANHQSLFYTEDSFEKYEDAFEYACVVSNNPYSEQAEIDEAYQDLKESFFGLEFDSLADYTQISYALYCANQLDSDLYTDYSLGLVEEIRNAAEAIPDNYFKTYQVRIDSIATELLNAVDNLPLLCGDLDANGTVDGNDAFLMSCIISGTLGEDDLGEYKYSATDANKDGSIDINDYDAIFNKGLFR